MSDSEFKMYMKCVNPTSDPVERLKELHELHEEGKLKFE